MKVIGLKLKNVLSLISRQHFYVVSLQATFNRNEKKSVSDISWSFDESCFSCSVCFERVFCFDWIQLSWNSSESSSLGPKGCSCSKWQKKQIIRNSWNAGEEDLVIDGNWWIMCWLKCSTGAPTLGVMIYFVRISFNFDHCFKLWLIVIQGKSL